MERGRGRMGGTITAPSGQPQPEGVAALCACMDRVAAGRLSGNEAREDRRRNSPHLSSSVDFQIRPSEVKQIEDVEHGNLRGYLSRFGSKTKLCPLKMTFGSRARSSRESGQICACIHPRDERLAARYSAPGRRCSERGRSRSQRLGSCGPLLISTRRRHAPCRRERSRPPARNVCRQLDAARRRGQPGRR